MPAGSCRPDHNGECGWTTHLYPGRPGTTDTQPPPRRNVLVLQGGGALGAYQAGVYDALAAHQTQIDWVAGVSIGAINGAIIAGNEPQYSRGTLARVLEPCHRADRQPGRTRLIVDGADAVSRRRCRLRDAVRRTRVFSPQPVLDWFYQPAPLSFYDTSELRRTLERLVDFDRINRPGGTRLSVGAVDVETGNLIYFDSSKQRIQPEHIMASGALPPGLAVVEIDGNYYWDGGLVSNTPLQYVVDFEPREDMLIFQVDLFPARGQLPKNLDEVAEREKDIRYSSRTRTGPKMPCCGISCGPACRPSSTSLPPELQENPVAQRLRAFACPKTVDIVHLIYRPTVPQGSTKDFQFVRGTIDQRWAQGAMMRASRLQPRRGTAHGAERAGARVRRACRELALRCDQNALFTTPPSTRSAAPCVAEAAGVQR